MHLSIHAHTHIIQYTLRVMLYVGKCLTKKLNLLSLQISLRSIVDRCVSHHELVASGVTVFSSPAIALKETRIWPVFIFRSICLSFQIS